MCAVTVLLWVLSGWAWLTPQVAWAQHPGIPRDRTLQERLALAERIAWVEVESVDSGRLHVTLREGLLGRLPVRFQIKRSPSNPPPLDTGSHAIVLLRGARPPFVLVDEPEETILAEEAGAAALAGAIRRAVESRGQPAALASVYQDWIDRDQPTLIGLAKDGLGQLVEHDEALRRNVALSRAPVAAQPGLPLPVRRTSALLAVGHPDGARSFVSALAASGAIDDPILTRLMLQAGATYRTPELARLFEASVHHHDPEIRRMAMRLVPAIASALGEDAVAAAVRLASEDPDNDVRRQAERAIHNARRPAPAN